MCEEQNIKELAVKTLLPQLYHSANKKRPNRLGKAQSLDKLNVEQVRCSYILEFWDGGILAIT